MQRGGAAIVDLIDALVAAQANGTPPDVLEKARKLQRRAQWRLDFIAAENSMGFHAPQEAAKVLGEAVDYARQGQVALLGGVTTPPFPSGPAGSSGAAPSAKPLAAPSASVSPGR
jgi:nitrite reductase (cytochrome c-552)